MGLFDMVKGMAENALGAEGEQQVMSALQSAGIPGLGGLVSQLQSSGLGSQVSSWIGTGANQSISAGDIEQALGGSALAAIAGKLGVDPAKASAMLSQVLPGMVDRATPDGNPPSDGAAP